MTSFKKDYINYVLHSISNSYSNKIPAQARIKNLLERIIQTDDLVKITFIVGKTAGLDVLFKYLLYISDKIDKSQISVTNLKGNYDYDVENLKKICEKIQQYKSPAVIEKLEIPEETVPVPETEEPEPKTADSEEVSEEIPEQENPELTLIENTDSQAASEEVFELTDLEVNEENHDIDQLEGEDEAEDFQIPEYSADDSAAEEQESGETGETEKVKEEPPLEIEINQPANAPAEEQSVTSEAYNKFENKFFEEVKILEKLFLKVYNEAKSGKMTKVPDKLLQSISEIIEISSELSNLTRELSFDLTADIFLTINLFFTRAINSPRIITDEKIMLLNSSLSLVNSLIKGGNYLNYDVIVDKIEQLKKDMVKQDEPKAQQKPSEKKQEKTEMKKPEKPQRVAQKAEDKTPPKEQQAVEKSEPKPEVIPVRVKQTVRAENRTVDTDTVIFKMKWIVKDFEKVFLSMDAIKGEYSRFEILEKIDELNNYLRLIAKLALSVKALDVCKLSEVSYVFLKYLKDFKMDLLEPEIQQIVKYMIFTFKMLLTDRRPEDFNVLVQYLNNPVKIFTDT